MERGARSLSQTSTRVAAAALSVALHLALVALVLFAGGPGDGLRDLDAPAMEWVALEPYPGRRPAPDGGAGPGSSADEPLPLPAPPLLRVELPGVARPVVDIPEVEPEDARPAQATAAQDALAMSLRPVPEPPVEGMPEVEATAILQRIEQAAADLSDALRTRVTWQQDGRGYVADLRLDPARDGVEPDRVVAEVSTEAQGRRMRTRLSLRRLPFSHYAQVIDEWDPWVQLHDDEIVGRLHVNSRFRVLHDAQAVPRLHGKVTTAAPGYTVEWRGHRNDLELFPDGVETEAQPIPFSGPGWSFTPATRDAQARVHELAGDTRIRFLGEDGYAWREGRSGAWRHEPPAGVRAVYFLAAPRAIVSVQGVVSGRFLVHSPRRIVVEGDLTYARDPRTDPQSGDFLGLVSDRDIEVAPASLTGPGDLHVEAALFAGRRIVVSEAERGGAATLHVFGSLAAGSLSESEPRYATRVVYDERFERLRPPGFPSTNQFAAEDWDRRWTEVPGVPAATGD